MRLHKFQMTSYIFCVTDTETLTSDAVSLLSTVDLTFMRGIIDPNYRKTGPWNDWVRVVYEDDDGTTTAYPMKVLGFVYDDDKRILFFGQMCVRQRNAEKQASCNGLIETWHLETRKARSGNPDDLRCKDGKGNIRVLWFAETVAVKAGGFGVPLSMDDYSSPILFVTDRIKEWPPLFL